MKLLASHLLLQQPRPPEEGAPAKSRMSQKLQTIRIATRFYCAIRHVRTHPQRRHTHLLCPDWMPRGSAGSKSCPELTSCLLQQCLQGNPRPLLCVYLWGYNYNLQYLLIFRRIKICDLEKWKRVQQRFLGIK